MNAKIQEIEIRPDLKVRKGSVVELDFDNDGRVIEAVVDDILIADDEVIIDSMTRNYGSPMSHVASQYRESARLIKF